MRYLMSLMFLSVAITSGGQETRFPADWLGKWKGDIEWYKGNATEPVVVKMQLNILPTDSAGIFSWGLVYGNPGEDARPYQLLSIDSSRGHWMIDERNGIKLDQYLVANRLSGAFTVQSSTIINNYWLNDGKLHIEFITISAKPLSTTGKGDKEIPFVDSYEVKGYQKAVLSRAND